MSDSWKKFTQDLAVAADLTRDTGAAEEDAVRIAGLHLHHEGASWWSIHHPNIEDHSLLDVVDTSEYRSARELLWHLYRLTHRDSAEPDTEGHRHGLEVA